MSWILGADPGNSGALAFLNPESGKIRILDMPIFEHMASRMKRELDVHTIKREIEAQEVANAYVEKVASSQQMGVASSFTFGEGFGLLKGIIIGTGTPLTLVRPQDWKKQMRVPADKRATVKVASDLFPDCAHLFKGPRGGIIDGRAEAALIALFGSMELGRAPTSPVKPWVEDHHAEAQTA